MRRLDRLNSRISLQIIVENSRNSEFCDSNYHSSLLAVQAAAFPYTAIIAEEGLVPKATIRLSGCVNISSFSSQLSLRKPRPRTSHSLRFLSPASSHRARQPGSQAPRNPGDPDAHGLNTLMEQLSHVPTGCRRRTLPPHQALRQPEAPSPVEPGARPFRFDSGPAFSRELRAVRQAPQAC